MNICEYFECPIHSIFWIPNIVLTRDNCSLCKQESLEAEQHIKQLETLALIYKLFKQIDKTCISKNNLLTEYEMFLWLLEGSIKDYEMIKAERAEVYYKLKETYNIMKENTLDCKTEIGLEHITQLETNIELCNQINNNIKNIFQKTEGILGQTSEQKITVASQYLLALFIDINEFIRLLNIHFNLLLE